MATLKVPYFKWRDGRPRWEPGPALRAAGFKGQDLKDGHGRWLDHGPAIALAMELNKDVEKWRAGAAPGAAVAEQRARGPAQKSPRSVAALYDAWIASPKFLAKAASTQRDYRMKAQRVLAEFGEVPVGVLRKSDLYSWWEELHRKHGHAMANGILAVARIMLSYAALKGWRSDNPAERLGLETLPPRVVVWTPSECAALVAKADQIGMPDVGDAVVIALNTAQRLDDVLNLTFQRTENGWAEFKQGKTNARVRVPLSEQLKGRLASIRRRRTSGGTIDLDNLNRVVLRSDTGAPHNTSSFNKAFRKVRAAISDQHPDAATKEFRDFRDTAITQLALADCTIPQIRAISGHKLETVSQVLEHYLALDDRMAQAASDKLHAWKSREGIAV